MCSNAVRMINASWYLVIISDRSQLLYQPSVAVESFMHADRHSPPPPPNVSHPGHSSSLPLLNRNVKVSRPAWSRDHFWSRSRSHSNCSCSLPRSHEVLVSVSYILVSWSQIDRLLTVFYVLLILISGHHKYFTSVVLIDYSSFTLSGT